MMDTSLNSARLYDLLRSLIRRQIIMLLLALGLTLPWHVAVAHTEIQGQIDQVRLRVENSSVKEILEALAQKFQLAYKMPVGDDRSLQGLYSGSLQEVLGRVLDGYGYVIEISNGRLSVVVWTRPTAAGGSNSGLAQKNDLPAAVQPVLVSHPAPEAVSPPLPSVPPLTAFLSSNGTVDRSLDRH
jgi:hypothetical protein